MEESSDSGASEDTSSLESGSSEEDQDITYKPLKASRQLCNRLADRNMPGLAEKSSKRKWQVVCRSKQFMWQLYDSSTS